MTVRDLLIGTLVPSANDAATALAVAAGGSVPRFVALDEPRGAAARAHRHALPEPARARSGRARLDCTRHRRAPPRRAPRPRDPALRRACRGRRSRTGAWSSRPTTCSAASAASSAARRGTRRRRAGRRSRSRASAASAITAAVLGSPSEAQRDRDLEALLRFGLGSYRTSRVVDPARTYATVPVGWGEPPVRAGRAARDRPARVDRAAARRSGSSSPPSSRCRSARASGSGRSSCTTASASSPARRSSRHARPSATRALARKAWWVTRRTVHHLVGLVPDTEPPDDRHRHPQRRARPLAHRPDPPARPAPPRERRPDARGRQGDQRRAGAQAARRPGRRHRARRRAHRHAHRRGADRRGDPQRLRPHRRRVADLDARGRPDVRDADRDQRVGAEGHRRRARACSWTSSATSRAAPTRSSSRGRCPAGVDRRRSTPTRRASSRGAASGSCSTPRASRSGSGVEAEPWLVVAEPARGRAARRAGAGRRGRLPDGARRRSRSSARATSTSPLESGCFALVREDAAGAPLPRGRAAARAGLGRRRRRRLPRAVARVACSTARLRRGGAPRSRSRPARRRCSRSARAGSTRPRRAASRPRSRCTSSSRFVARSGNPQADSRR